MEYTVHVVELALDQNLKLLLTEENLSKYRKLKLSKNNNQIRIGVEIQLSFQRIKFLKD